MLKKILSVQVLIFLWCLPAFLPGSPITSFQEKTQGDGLCLSGRVDKTQVPLNRTLELMVSLSWTGNPDDYFIVRFEDPLLTNFEITGTTTSKRSATSAGTNTIFNDFIYTLRPKELGMGYIESAAVTVRKKDTEEDATLATRRIPVEVVNPLHERENGRLFSPFLIGGIILLALILTALIMTVKKIKSRPLPEEPKPPLETIYLERLHSSVDSSRPDLKEDFSLLSRLIRNYLAEKFSLAAREATTASLVKQLERTSLKENQVSNLADILHRTDEITFSGTQGNKEELMQFITLTEGILEGQLRKSEDEKNESAKKK
ncbi:MAG: hypothetical protein JXB26_04210 [Candidatus Aminicenantes bacterium]|nr:hypothetical protein [Candidatus Aminicenantes bacterium]